jgi:hypothetical protein
VPQTRIRKGDGWLVERPAGIFRRRLQSLKSISAGFL